MLLPGLDTSSRTAASRSRVARSRKAHSEAPAPKPWLAVVLAVDTARRSGCAVLVSGRLAASGEVDTLDHEQVARVVRFAVQRGEQRGLPVVMVLEKPWGGSVQVVAALGVARERWQRAWRDAGQSRGRVVLVRPSTWRGPVLGREAVRASRDEVRARELSVASAILGRAASADQAAAVLIGRWAVHAAQVGRVIGERAKRASKRAWRQRGG